MKPPAPAARSASDGTRSVPPVARRMWVRKSGLPTSRTTIFSPSISPIRLPCRPWRAGKQPVDTDAADTRVTDGNTALCSAHHRLVPAISCRTGVVSLRTQSRPRPSQHTNTARRDLAMAKIPSSDCSGRGLRQPCAAASCAGRPMVVDFDQQLRRKRWSSDISPCHRIRRSGAQGRPGVGSPGDSHGSTSWASPRPGSASISPRRGNRIPRPTSWWRRR